LIGSKSRQRKQFPKELVRRLTQQLYLIDTAYAGFMSDKPRDAFLLIESSRDSGNDQNVTNGFAAQLGAMYQNWAKTRKMRYTTLEEPGLNGQFPYQILLAISGFGAFTILERENGLHVLEKPGTSEKDFIRYKVHVRVAAQPEEPPGHGEDALLIQARDAFEQIVEKRPTIVRRYRQSPSPLIRDSVRNWRTGNYEEVLNGNFDLIS
jgi:ATP-dependent Clp protease ATP-binding subunit ClpC